MSRFTVKGIDDPAALASIIRTQVRLDYTLSIVVYVCVTAVICSVIMRCG